MTDSEILTLDAEMRFANNNGDATAFEWSNTVGPHNFSRLGRIESEHGKWQPNNIDFSEYDIVETLVLFSLIVAESLKG